MLTRFYIDHQRKITLFGKEDYKRQHNVQMLFFLKVVDKWFFIFIIFLVIILFLTFLSLTVIYYLIFEGYLSTQIFKKIYIFQIIAQIRN